MQFPLRASEDTSVFSMQSTPDALAVASQNQDLETDDVWNVWPYCWAINGWDLAQERFHSFHKKLIIWNLSRHNHRAQEQFRARFWRNWNREEVAEVEMRLL